MNRSNEEDVEKAKSLISTGAEIAGAAVGGAIGFFAAGPAGAAGAGSLGVIVAKAGAKLLGDVADRAMSAREKVRVGATAAVAFNKIEKASQSGNEPRKDGFFNSEEGKRSNAEEILEGTLRRAREEYEEKKILLLGNFYANMVYSPGVSTEEANYYLRLFDSLTYRQLCIMSLIMMKPQYSDFQNLRKHDYRTKNANMQASTVALLQEIYALYNLGLVCVRSAGGNGYVSLLAWHDIIPFGLEFTGLGERFYKLFMGGGSISLPDISTIAESLR
ncbi:hypothetical protein HKX68_03120 [Dickeya dadantii]|uniref:hypothetical protein n=1 Tax=Dickeya dadantii TaxID=204038 RepID=UPI001372C181|nr:hypothetical protein [Dickeya dadantii]NAT75993.1 hypothetical protein [Dickeya dadantii]NPE62074.1 hypothetical protein [Dickeya dadantii]